MSSPTTSVAASSAVPLSPEPVSVLVGKEILPAAVARRRAFLDRLTPALAFCALLASWEAICRLFAVPSFLLPSPSQIVTAFIATPPLIWTTHALATLRVALLGYVLAVAVSLPLAIGIATSRLLRRTLYPMLVIVQSTPIVAVAPIIVVTLGATDLPRIVITFLITFFPILVSTVTGLQATPPELIELSRALRAGRAREIWHVRLPFALPHLFAALRISTTLAIIGAVVAEFVAAEKGLGFFIAFSTSNFKIPTAFAGLAVLVTISLALFQLVGWAQRRLAPWSLPRKHA